MANFGILHCKKINAGAVNGIRSHMLREFVSKSNPDIDYAQTRNNDVIISSASLMKRINERIAKLQLKKKLRKDAVVLVDTVMTASPEFVRSLSLEQQEKFFDDCLQFIRQKYGEENVMYAVVHRDESNPHIHVGFMPVTDDQRLCAKDVLSRKNLVQLQDDFYEIVSQKYGLERGLKAEDERKNNPEFCKKHMETEEYKEYKSVKETVEKYSETTEKVQNLLRRASKNLFGGKYSMDASDLRVLGQYARDSAVAKTLLREVTRERDRLRNAVAVRNSELEYERGVNATLRDKVHRANAYLAASADDRAVVDAFLAQRATGKNKEEMRAGRENGRDTVPHSRSGGR